MPYNTTATATVLTSAARTASGVSATQSIGNGTMLRIFVNVTAVSGTTPTLDIKTQEAPDLAGTWYVTGTLAQITAAGQYTFLVNPAVGPYFQLVYTIAGTTPSFTFTATSALY